MGWFRRYVHRKRRGRNDGAHHAGLSESAYRRDIQGLRAIAVLLVVLDHAGVRFFSGGYVGVDVFFVLSGFLITGLLLAGVEKRGYVSFVDFYVRRAKRILPAATLTLVVTIIASYLFLNVVRAREAVWDSVWASLFAANIHFAREGTDYFAQGQPPSPVQHYWSLSVEEQFYFVWPAMVAVALFGLGAYSTRRRRGRNRRPMHVGAARRLLFVAIVAAAASLTWSILRTDEDPTAAYFSTLTRAWELAFGAILAIAAAHVARLPSSLKVVMSWAGLAAIGVAAVAFSSTTAFPGYAALLPTLGAVLVIAGGCTRPDDPRTKGRSHAEHALASRPMRYIGDRSYAWYLWHWPVLVIAAQYAGRELSVGLNLLLVAGAFLLSMASYAFVENPIRRSDWSTSATWTLVPASAAVVAGTAMFALTSIDAKVLNLEAASAASPTASAIRQPAAAATAPIGGSLAAVRAAVQAAHRGAALPSGLTPPVDRLLDSSYLYDVPSGCAPASDEQTTSRICRLGSTSSRRSVVVFGDSHAIMWMPAILAMGSRDGWAVIPLVKSGCVPSVWKGGGYEGTPAVSRRQCHEWYAWASRQAASLRPDVVLMAGCCAGATGRVERETIEAYAALARTVKRTAKRVIVIEDPAGVDRQPVDCLLGRRATMRTCTTQWPDDRFALADDLEALAGQRGYRFMRTRGWFCLGQECPMIVGRTVVYRDTGHITGPYATLLAGPFRGAFGRCTTKGCPTGA